MWRTLWLLEKEDRISGSGADLRVINALWAKVEQGPTLSMRKMANRQNVNPNTIKTTVNICQVPMAPTDCGFKVKKTEKKKQNSSALTQGTCWHCKNFPLIGNTRSRCSCQQTN